MSDSITSRVLFNVFKVSLLVISLSLFLVAWLLNKDNLAKDAWPTTDAKIFYSQVVKRSGTFLGHQTKWYDLNIKYGYVVNKQRYDKQGLFVESIDHSLNREFFEEKAQQFKKDDIVKVHYNPQNPKQAYLVANIDSGIRTFYGATQKMVLFTLFLFIITPLINYFKEKGYKTKNSVEQGLIVPDDVKRVMPGQRYR